jgi:hypothetical protein
MTRRTEIVGTSSYIFSPDDPAPPPATRFWAVVTARVLDELTGAPPRGDMNIKSTYPGLTPRVASDGLLGLVGIPMHAFPSLGAQPYVVKLTVSASGYVPHHEETTIPVNAGFPNSFTPKNLDLELHREPVVIRGRTVAASGNTTTPLTGMNVSLTGIWRTVPPGNVVVPPDAPRLLSLQPPLYLKRTTPTAMLRRREMVPIAGQDKELQEDVYEGGGLLHLSNSVNLAVGNIIAVDALDAERREFLTVQAIAGSRAPGHAAAGGP